MKIFIALILAMSLYANVKQEMLGLYQNKKYENACKLGFNNFNANDKDEDYISLFAFACLNADSIDRLTIPIIKLKFSPEARANGAYFSVIMMQKKLLYHALLDGYKLSSLNLPTTDYILSKVFDLYSQLNEETPKEFYIFEDKDDKKITYKLYLLKDEKLSKLIIDEFYDKKIIKQHIYW
ncbi:MAG: hypothetical protein NTW78_03525 [Campylobacterales bacterium]|nr:hypothetical protein [Campylobacterales bacterium]